MANRVPKKKSRKKWIFLLLLILAVSAVVYWRSVPEKEKIVMVQTEKIQRRTITQVVTASGKIQPERMVKINAEVSGEIIELAVVEGQPIKKGQPLVRIKPDQYQAQVERAQAALVSAKAQLSSQSASLDKSRADFQRLQDLYQKKVIAEQDFISTKMNLLIAQAQQEAAEAGVAQAQAALKEATENLAKTIVYAPMEGIISQLKSEVGERVSGSSFTQGTEMMTLADLTMMEARVDVGESDVVLLTIGNVTRLEVDAYPDRKFKGVVAEIGNTGKTKGQGTQDEVTSFEVKIRILDKEVTFRPGMSVTADIETQTHANVLAVPIQSVTTRLPKPKEDALKNGAKGQDSPKAETTDNPRNVTGNAKHAAEENKPIEVLFIVTGTTVQMKPVQRGISDEFYVEITQGVTENWEVVSGSYKAIHKELEDSVKIEREDKNKGTVAQ